MIGKLRFWYFWSCGLRLGTPAVCHGNSKPGPPGEGGHLVCDAPVLAVQLHPCELGT